MLINCVLEVLGAGLADFGDVEDEVVDEAGEEAPVAAAL
jgi:hypothetical protein